jgi:hypothetical protein
VADGNLRRHHGGKPDATNVRASSRLSSPASIATCTNLVFLTDASVRQAYSIPVDPRSGISFAPPQSLP